MLYYDVLDEMAETYIPCTRHELLHINPRVVWVETIADLIESGKIKGSKEELMFYAHFWEPLLFKKYSALN